MTSPNPSLFTRLLRYAKTKSRNAYWVLRTKGVAAFCYNIKLEITGRITQALTPKQPEPPKNIPGSAFHNKCRLLPPSTKPTGSFLSQDTQLINNKNSIGEFIHHLKQELRNSEAIQGNLYNDD